MNGQEHHRLSAVALAMVAWKSRLVMGFKRTWMHARDSTLGQTKASLTFYVTINKVVGDAFSHSEHPSLGLVECEVVSSPDNAVVLGSN